MAEAVTDVRRGGTERVEDAGTWERELRLPGTLMATTLMMTSALGQVSLNGYSD